MRPTGSPTGPASGPTARPRSRAARRSSTGGRAKGKDPREKLLIFSDGLDVDAIEDAYQHFSGRVRMAFGWGTNLTNDFAGCSPMPNPRLDPISLVCKVSEANGRPAVKLSDNPEKATGDAARDRAATSRSSATRTGSRKRSSSEAEVFGLHRVAVRDGSAGLRRPDPRRQGGRARCRRVLVVVEQGPRRDQGGARRDRAAARRHPLRADRQPDRSCDARDVPRGRRQVLAARQRAARCGSDHRAGRQPARDEPRAAQHEAIVAVLTAARGAARPAAV